MAAPGLAVVEGSVTKVIFRSVKTSYSILEVKMERIAGQTESTQSKKKFRLRKAVLTGHCPSVEKGSFVKASGKWVETPRHGLQLHASSISHVPPSSGEACKRYLKTFRGVGPKRAKEIVDAFPNENVFDILSSKPERLMEVKGIGQSALGNILSQWSVRKAQYEAAEFLHSVGIGPAIAERLASYLGGTPEACAKEVRSDPYAVVDKSAGLLSFPHADGIAVHHLGVSLTDMRRLREAAVYITTRLAWSGGHTCISSEAVAQATTRLLKIKDVSLVRSSMNDERFLRLPSVDEGVTVSPLKLFQAEIAIARALKELLDVPHPLPYIDPEASVRSAEKAFGGTGQQRLAAMQAEAVRKAMQCKVLVITGGPGVGKTTAISSIVNSFKRLRMQVVVASPTGRASAKLTQVTGQPAATIHRLLEYDPELGTFRRNAENKLQGSLFLLDEVSMIDAELAAAFFAAIPSRSVVVLVGDVDQLPAVGPGNVLLDLVQSERIPTVRLDRIFRQQEQSSHIVRLAHGMLQGKMYPVMPYSIGSGTEAFDDYVREADLRFVAADSPTKVVTSIVNLLHDLKARFGIDPIEDVQVLTAMRKGPLGSRAFNNILQQQFNQTQDTSQSAVGDPNGVFRFRRGDKVMQIVNDYHRDVFNGEIGRVHSVDPESGIVRVHFPSASKQQDDEDSTTQGKIVEYRGADDLGDIEPAFACTIHKSQGCEFPVVVIPVHSEYDRVLQRNVLYTAITRGTRLAVIVGDMRAFEAAIQKVDATQRKSFLKNRIWEYCGAPSSSSVTKEKT